MNFICDVEFEVEYYFIHVMQRDDWNFYSFNVAREVISGVVTVWNKDLSVMCNRVAGVEDVKTSLKFVFVELTHDFREMG